MVISPFENEKSLKKVLFLIGCIGFSLFLCVLVFTYVQGVSKKFGEWYQEKKKKEDTNKITILAFKMNLLLHNTLLATFIKASGKCQERPL
jgi:hypothetical protein